MKLKIFCNGFKVSYSGDEQFAKESLCSLVSSLKEIVHTDEAIETNSDITSQDTSNGKKPLPVFLKEMEKQNPRNKRQYRKFLVTAAWLHLNGHRRLTTGDVSSALLSNQITRLSNASDSLSTNVEHRHCQRDGRHFFVTQEGFQSLQLEFPYNNNGHAN